MTLILMGTGTSHGVPVISCKCKTCTSKDKRDKRLRCAALVENKNSDGSITKILIDIGPEFRIQALKYKIDKLDAVLLTHGHADHIYGLDDIRIFSHTESCGKCKNSVKKGTPGEGLKFYANENTVLDVKNRFDYIFMETQLAGGKPKISLQNINKLTQNNPLKIGDIEIIPIPMKHGNLNTNGYMFSVYKNGIKKSILYLTDCSFIPNESIDLIKKNGGIIQASVIDGLREEEHSTHFNYLQAVEVGNEINSKEIYLTHITHQHTYKKIKKYLNQNLNKFDGLKEKVKNGYKVLPSYDGLKIKV